MTEPLKTTPSNRPSVGSLRPATGGNGAGAGGRGPRIAGGAADGSDGGMKMPPIDQLKGRPLGRVLIKMGRLTREQVHQGLAVQTEQKAKGVNTPIGQILVDLGLISDKDRNLALAAQMGYEMYDLVGKTIPKDVLDRIGARWPPPIASFPWSSIRATAAR